MKPWTSIRLSAAVAIAWVAVYASAPARCLAGSANRFEPRLPTTLIGLTEEDIPAAEMPATATPTPAQPGAEPAGQNSPAVAATASPTPAAESSLPAPAGAPPTSQAGGEGAPTASPAEVAPPLEIGAVKPEGRISDSPLEDVIRNAAAPARAASLRLVDRAREQILNNEADDAIRMLGRAVSIDPSNPYAYFYLGRAWLQRKNYPQALTFLKHAEIGFSSNSAWLGETFAFEGVAYEQSDNVSAAAAAYQQAMQTSPGNLMARVGYARIAPQAQASPADVSGPAPGSAVAPPPAEPPPPPPEAEVPAQ